MIYRFTIEGLSSSAYFDVPVNKEYDLDNYRFVRFSSNKSSKIVTRFFKDEVCLGGKPSSSSIIDGLGFFDVGYQQWDEFELFNKSIIYEFFKKDYGIIMLYPNHIAYTHDRKKTEILDL